MHKYGLTCKYPWGREIEEGDNCLLYSGMNQFI